MKIFNLNADEWDRTEEREGWRFKDAWVGAHTDAELIGASMYEVEQQAQWRIYRLRPEPLAELDSWLARYRAVWEQRLDALHTEVARGRRKKGRTE